MMTRPLPYCQGRGIANKLVLKNHLSIIPASFLTLPLVVHIRVHFAASRPISCAPSKVGC